MNQNASKEDNDKARKTGVGIVGCAKPCPRCGGNAYCAPKPNWQNRVVCLSCGRKWSQ